MIDLSFYPQTLRSRLMIGLFCLGFLCSPAQILNAEPETPEQALETFLATIHTMQFPVKDRARHGELLRQANAFLDLESMTQDALQEHWGQAAGEERNLFMDLMWRLIEQSAYPRSREFLGEFEILYPEIHQAGKGFEVVSVVKREEEALNAKVVYHVYRQDRQWKIDDVILDGVSLIEDMRYQFDRIIRESSFSGLLKRMQEKLDQSKQQGEGKSL